MRRRRRNKKTIWTQSSSYVVTTEWNLKSVNAVHVILYIIYIIMISVGSPYTHQLLYRYLHSCVMGSTILAMLWLKRYVTTNDTYYYCNGYTDQSHIIIYTTLVCIEYNNNIYTDSIILYDIIIWKYYRHITYIYIIQCKYLGR